MEDGRTDGTVAWRSVSVAGDRPGWSGVGRWGGSSGPDDLDVISGVESDLSVIQQPFAPALLVLVTQLH